MRPVVGVHFDHVSISVSREVEVGSTDVALERLVPGVVSDMLN